jgi:hypothetical protein
MIPIPISPPSLEDDEHWLLHLSDFMKEKHEATNRML